MRFPEVDYRVYCHDSALKLVSAEWLEATTDAEAIDAVQRLYSKLDCEIWRGKELVAKLVPGRDLNVPPARPQSRSNPLL